MQTRYRVELGPEGEVAINGWASIKDDVVEMDHVYPDHVIEAGWHLACRLGHYEVVSVSGKSLRIREA